MFAEKHLSTIKRRSGESYAQHGFEVALALKEVITDVSLLRVALLHDLLVHPRGFILLKQSPLNEDEQVLAAEMHALRRLHLDMDTGDLSRTIESFVHDERLLFLRMAHRLNDVRHLERFDDDLKLRIARESLYMYGAIAGRLGMHQWRNEMENTCFLIVEPDIANQLKAQFDAVYSFDERFLSATVMYLEEQFAEQKLTCRLQKRIKGLYSCYRKMVLKNRTFQDLTDRLAIRVLVDEPMDCYRALGVLHSVTRPIPGKLKDYIGAPKENGYQSIHTVIYPIPGVTDQPIEIQIRTHQMHKLCEFGPAAHGNYKKGQYVLQSGASRVHLMKNLSALKGDLNSPLEFAETLRSYFDDNQVAVFDDENRLYHLKKPATVLDFIFLVHPKQSTRLKQVKINGRLAPSDTLLKSGDVVEPIFGRTKHVELNWIDQSHHEDTHAKIRSDHQSD